MGGTAVLAGLVLAGASAGNAALGAPPLTVTYRSGLDLPLAAVDQNGAAMTIAGLSGITRLEDGRFLAVMDNSDKAIILSVTFDDHGVITGAVVDSGLRLAESKDFEGVAAARGGVVWLSEETTPAIRRYVLSDGSAAGVMPTPAVYSNRRANYGLESLALDPFERSMWTANEEALTVDGPLSTTTTGTVVRLQRFLPGQASARQQFAWRTAPVHGAWISGQKSGVSDLVALPDGRVLVLERSFALSISAPFQTRIYEADFTNATDVSAFAELQFAVFTPVGKRLLYSGALTNVEGLCLGPTLPNGHAVLLGVIDDGDPLSVNRLVSFEITGVVRPACRADIATAGASNPASSGPDGFVTGDDFDGFLTAFFEERRSPQGWLIADIAGGLGQDYPDGFLTGADFDAFVTLFFGGC